MATKVDYGKVKTNLNRVKDAVQEGAKKAAVKLAYGTKDYMVDFLKRNVDHTSRKESINSVGITPFRVRYDKLSIEVKQPGYPSAALFLETGADIAGKLLLPEMSKRAGLWFNSEAPGIEAVKISKDAQIVKGNEPKPMENTFKDYTLKKGPSLLAKELMEEIERSLV